VRDTDRALLDPERNPHGLGLDELWGKDADANIALVRGFMSGCVNPTAPHRRDCQLRDAFAWRGEPGREDRQAPGRRRMMSRDGCWRTT